MKLTEHACLSAIKIIKNKSFCKDRMDKVEKSNFDSLSQLK